MANFTTPQSLNPYAAFDPAELRNKIIDRLNQGQVFTDQNYQGSNLSAIIDIIGYVFGTLMYYNSKASSESMFSDAQLYENMNRIVKLINYKPIGRLAQNVPFSLSVTADLNSSTYVIPRFCSVVSGGTTFTLTSDLIFTKNTNNLEAVQDINNNYLLHQGVIEEYPLYTAIGVDNEVVFLSLNEDVQIDHYNIFVYVKSQNNAWKEYKRVEDRSTYKADDEIFEIRFNHNKRYEITFGDGINGISLKTNDLVAIYYLHIDPSAVNIGSGALNDQHLLSFNSIQYQHILKDTSNVFGTYLNQNQFKYLQFSNEFPSSNYSPEESIDSIRINAPKNFRSQHRLITADDYSYYISTNFNNLVLHTSVINNDDYLTGHLRYLYDIGLDSPQTENHVLFNQVKFANSCNFNNIYIYSIPQRNLLYLNSPQKEYIINQINNLKTITSHIVFMDPEYMYFDFCVKDLNGNFKITDPNLCTLKIYKSKHARRSDAAIKYDVMQVFIEAFNKSTLDLGTNINTHQLSTYILSIDGVDSIRTERKDDKNYVEEISFLVWNAKYPQNDSDVFTQTKYLEYYQFALFNNIENISSRIEIVDPNGLIKIPEF